MVSVWQFDDLWEEGYRFDDIINPRYCHITREQAKDEYEALDFLDKNFENIPKIKGTSNVFIDSHQIVGKNLILVKHESLIN